MLTLGNQNQCLSIQIFKCYTLSRLPKGKFRTSLILEFVFSPASHSLLLFHELNPVAGLFTGTFDVIPKEMTTNDYGRAWANTFFQL